MNEYRAFVRALAATDDVAFAEYISNLVYPPHLEEMVGFLHEHSRALVLEPRGHAKTSSVSAPASAAPSRTNCASLRVLLRIVRGLPLMARIFMVVVAPAQEMGRRGILWWGEPGNFPVQV